MNDFAVKASARRAARVSSRLERALVGLPPDEQGLILAHLLSLWLAGHFVAEELDKEQRPRTQTVRNMLLLRHTNIVREMISANEPAVLARKRAHPGGAPPVSDELH